MRRCGGGGGGLEAAAEEGGEEETAGGEVLVVTVAAATAMLERRSRPTLEALGVFEGGVVSTLGVGRVRWKGVMDGWMDGC